jgi:hypothetical protein
LKLVFLRHVHPDPLYAIALDESVQCTREQTSTVHDH